MRWKPNKYRKKTHPSNQTSGGPRWGLNWILSYQESEFHFFGQKHLNKGRIFSRETDFLPIRWRATPLRKIRKQKMHFLEKGNFGVFFVFSSGKKWPACLLFTSIAKWYGLWIICVTRKNRNDSKVLSLPWESWELRPWFYHFNGGLWLWSSRPSNLPGIRVLTRTAHLVAHYSWCEG